MSRYTPPWGLPRPAMTYGAQKLVGEVLVDDFSRRGWIDGHSLRLPGVLGRPPARTGQLSAFLSDIIRELAAGRPVYVTFDIDSVDPAFAPGTGTPEVGGLTSYEAQELVRGLAGLNVVACDVVEVAPPFDGPGQITALLAANIMFELLCVIARSRAGVTTTD